MLHDVAWCCVVLRGVAWCCVVLRGAAWCCGVLKGTVYRAALFHLPTYATDGGTTGEMYLTTRGMVDRKAKCHEGEVQIPHACSSPPLSSLASLSPCLLPTRECCLPTAVVLTPLVFSNG